MDGGIAFSAPFSDATAATATGVTPTTATTTMTATTMRRGANTASVPSPEPTLQDLETAEDEWREQFVPLVSRAIVDMCVTWYMRDRDFTEQSSFCQSGTELLAERLQHIADDYRSENWWMRHVRELIAVIDPESMRGTEEMGLAAPLPDVEPSAYVSWCEARVRRFLLVTRMTLPTDDAIRAASTLDAPIDVPTLDVFLRMALRDVARAYVFVLQYRGRDDPSRLFLLMDNQVNDEAYLERYHERLETLAACVISQTTMPHAITLERVSEALRSALIAAATAATTTATTPDFIGTGIIGTGDTFGNENDDGGGDGGGDSEGGDGSGSDRSDGSGSESGGDGDGGEGSDAGSVMSLGSVGSASDENTYTDDDDDNDDNGGPDLNAIATSTSATAAPATVQRILVQRPNEHHQSSHHDHHRHHHQSRHSYHGSGSDNGSGSGSDNDDGAENDNDDDDDNVYVPPPNPLRSSRHGHHDHRHSHQSHHHRR